MFDEPISDFAGGDEEHDLIKIPDQANLCVGAIKESRDQLIYLSTGRPDDDDLDQDDPRYATLLAGYRALDVAITELGKAFKIFVEASS